MELSIFIKSLIGTGTVSVKGSLNTFSSEDLETTAMLLTAYYQEDILDMPYIAPQFSQSAALWASKYFYTAVQLMVLRDIPEDIILKNLVKYPDEVTPSVIYSADLILRHLPDLFNVARGLSPADILVQTLKETASQWPFSSVGIELEELAQEHIIFSNASLMQTYTDRIIERKDQHRADTEPVKSVVLATMGEYSAVLWS